MTKRCAFFAPPELLDALSGCLFDAGVEGVLEGATGDSLITFVDEARVERLEAAFAEFERNARAVFPDAEPFEVEISEADDEWRDLWLAALDAEEVTARWTLRPLHRTAVPKGENTLWYRPTQSFGSGGHPTTRLAARALESYAAARPGERLLDVGTGTGVLALVALASGFAHVVGVDVEPVAVESLLESATLNDFGGRVTGLVGSADAVEERFACVVANIEASILRPIAGALADRLAPGGSLFLAGLLVEDEPGLRSVYEGEGLRFVERDEEGEWGLLRFRRPSEKLEG